MRTYSSGLIFPERAPLSLATVRSQIHNREGREVASIALNIYANQVTAAVDSADVELPASPKQTASPVQPRLSRSPCLAAGPAGLDWGRVPGMVRRLAERHPCSVLTCPA